MQGVSPNINKGESPKTPGGISKSLLTPCRRVGLSRKWKKSGCSPFISPFSSQNSTPERQEVSETKKRKKYNESEKQNETPVEHYEPNTPKSVNNSHKNNDITTTPCRNTQIPRKKSKTLTLTLQNSQENKEDFEILANKISIENESRVIESDNALQKKIAKNCVEFENKHIEGKISNSVKQISDEVSKPVRTESKGKYRLSLKKSLSKSECNVKQNLSDTICENTQCKEKSPNNLTKECIVVIQNKIFKTENKDTQVITEKVCPESDTEYDIPLSILKNNSENVTLNTLNDDDFIGKCPEELHFKNIQNLSTTIESENRQNCKESKASQSSQEDIKKKTILIKKCYAKVTKPLKAKSTGSITQKDIDDIRSRIEMKKNLLMAKAMSVDTEELRGLIKKWQKGCQDALMELLELMKKKLPDRQNMDYAEILQTLKIPPELVGYDTENDCFVTPDDTNVLLSTFKL